MSNRTFSFLCCEIFNLTSIIYKTQETVNEQIDYLVKARRDAEIFDKASENELFEKLKEQITIGMESVIREHLQQMEDGLINTDNCKQN